jgi:hypothetical protein
MSDSTEQTPVVDAPLATPVDRTDEQPREERARLSGYRRRFGVIYLVLALFAGAGVGALIVLLAQPEAAPTAAWSAWEPSGSETARVRQIADHVSTRYRFPEGDQLVVAIAGPPTVTAGGDPANPIPVRAIAVRPDTSRGKAEEDDIQIVDATKSMQFQLCGLGDSCSIAQGQPSEARHMLLRRQALELALYTFKYVDGVDSVTIFLPPPPGPDAQSSAVFLRRGDVKDQLSKPLSKTLAPGAPSIGQIPANELQALNGITGSRLYNFQYTQAQDLSAVLVLDPIIA